MTAAADAGLALLAVVAAIDSHGKHSPPASWCADLIQRAVAQVASAGSIAATAVLAGDGYQLVNPDGSERLVLYDRARSGCQEQTSVSAAKLCGKFTHAISETLQRQTELSGILFVDPHCISRTDAQLADCISLYFSQLDRPRPWLTVVSMSEVQNHYHPKKVLSMDDTGALQYFDPEGVNVYCRQQLDDEPVFVINGAVRIVDPLIESEQGTQCRVLGYVMNGPFLTVRSKLELDWMDSSRAGV
jgi:hypothetical protein